MNIRCKLTSLVAAAAVAFLATPCAAQRLSTNAASLGVALVRGFPGGLSQLPISLGNTGTVVAAQFDLSYPSAHLSPGSLAPGNFANDVVVRSRQIAPGVLRYLIYSDRKSTRLNSSH